MSKEIPYEGDQKQVFLLTKMCAAALVYNNLASHPFNFAGPKMPVLFLLLLLR